MSERFSVETLAVVLIVALIGVLAFLQLTAVSFDALHPGAINSDSNQGTQLLFSWLAQSGYQVEVAESELVLEETAVLFMIAPSKQLDFIEAERLNHWVFNGGTLILVQEQNQAKRLLDKYDIRSRTAFISRNSAEFNLPTLNWPFVGRPELRARQQYRVPCGEVAVHLGNCNQAHLAVFNWNAGQIVLVSSLYPLSNQGVQNPANAQLIQNLINLVASPGDKIVVDETHHGSGLFSLWRSRLGLVLLATAVSLIAYFIWQNQPFPTPNGRSAMIVEPDGFQSTSGFINHLATAQKELDPQRHVRDQFWSQLKRKFANRHGFDPRLNDDAFFDRLRPIEDEETIGRLIYIMTSMARAQVDDLELMHWMSVALDELGDEASG